MGLMMRAGRILLLWMAIASCGSTTVANTDRYLIGDYAIHVPTTWRVNEEPVENGFNIVEPPEGDGRLAFIELHYDQTGEFNEAFAREQAEISMSAIGLDATDLSIRQIDPSHFVTTAEGVGNGEHVIAAVHVMAPNKIVIGAFHSPDASDPMSNSARLVLDSVAALGTEP